LYLGYNRVYEDGSGDWQRIAIFASQASQIGTPEPDPSVNDGALFVPENLVLRSTLPSMPAGTQITGSRWEVDSLSDSTRIYTGNNTGSATTHKVQTMLPAGSYVWRVAYDWERAGIETVRGSTNWSKEAAIEVTNLRFTVTFDSQGGNYIAPIANIPYGTSIASPSDPARSGYTFDDWYSDADYQQPWDFSTAVTDNVTLYAKWIKDNSSGGCDSLSLGLGLLSLASLALLEKKHGQ
jgi:uncharacterized repeat protein (TIGR02543 family)